jgi:hypothetical protein
LAIVVIAALGALDRLAAAATLTGLYSVTVERDPRASDPESAALQAAMTRLLVRVTGTRDVALDPALQQLIGTADDYRTSSGLDRQGRWQFGFSRRDVERELTELGKPVWGPERPLTLLWVAVDDGAGGRALLGADDTAEPGVELTPAMAQRLETVRAEIVAAADERGLPIAWPLLDLQDLAAVTFADVWGGFEDRILAASTRYRADAVLIGRVRPGVLGNDVEWLFVNGIERRAIPQGVIRDGLDAAADRYAAELSTIGGASLTSLIVHNVSTVTDYGRVMSYLERQSVLERVDVESFADGILSLRVAARGDPQVVGRVLALGGVLRPTLAAGTSGPLSFEVVGTNTSP